MPFSHPQLTHTSAHITRKGRIYYYRRRLPKPRCGEVGFSLRTDRYREAEYLAVCLDSRLREAIELDVATKDVTSILRQHLQQLLEQFRSSFRETPPPRSIFLQPASCNEDSVDADLEMAEELIAQRREDIGRRNWVRVYEDTAELMRAHGVPEEQRAELAEGVLANEITAYEELRDRLRGRLPIRTAGKDEMHANTARFEAEQEEASRPEPRLSTLEEEFFAAMKGKNIRPWPAEEIRKARSVFSLFRDWCGDKPFSAYKRSEIYDFYKALAQLPRNHGKSPVDRQRTMQERIEAALDNDVPRLTAKTMEGYATRLIALLDYFRDPDKVDWINPTAGFAKFEELGRASMTRKMWEGEPLRQLLAAPVWTGCASEARPKSPGEYIYANERYWLPILALYQGARLEELARLVREEICQEDGIVFLNITDEEPISEDGKPVARKARVKTAAAKRRVPLHRAVLELGFLDYVEHIAPNGGDFLFPKLKANSRRDNHRSGKFSQWFTEYRRNVGVDDPRYVFHSFRAGVATKLLSSPGVAMGCVIALIGHQHEIAATADAHTLFNNYLKSRQIPLGELQDTINRVTFPEAHGLRRPTVFGDGSSFPVGK